MIYQMFLEGKTPSGIARHLMESGIPSPSGKKKWQASTVDSILRNEKYKGDAVLQKCFTVDFLTKKMKVNEGEVPQYYVENSHTAIISPEVHDLVQNELKKRRGTGRHLSGTGCFAGKIICGECGSVYGSKVWHSTSKYRRTIWRCNHKFSNAEKCTTPHLYEADLERAFVEAINSLIANKDALIQEFTSIINALMDDVVLETECTRLRNESDVVLELMRKSVEENAQTALDQDDFARRYGALQERYETAKRRVDALLDEKQAHVAKRESISRFLSDLRQRDGIVETFDEELWYSTVDTVTVYSAGGLTFLFKNGMEIKVQEQEAK
jgi:hypothetical protein